MRSTQDWSSRERLSHEVVDGGLMGAVIGDCGTIWSSCDALKWARKLVTLDKNQVRLLKARSS